MAQLAIKGHATRGSEVIELLEMLGGKNPYAISTAVEGGIYAISNYDKRIIACFSTEQLIIFTLEEFLEKFPYKVGNKVRSKYLKNYKIEKMEWEDTNNKVIYKLQGMGWYNANELQPYKEETMEEKENLVVINHEHKQLKVHSLRYDKVKLIINDEYELNQEGDAYYIVRKKKQLRKFKVGDRIHNKTYKDYIYDVLYLTDKGYKIKEINADYSSHILFEEQDNYELAPNKFDITTLNAFDKVLVRDSDKDMWRASIFSNTWKDRYFCVGAWHNQCIPYDVNKELLGTTDDCDDFYKIW